MIDQFGRVHDYLRISLTERCNLRCTYCMPEEGVLLRPKSEFMSASEIFEIAKTFVNLGVKKIRLTGGEPLVRKDAKEIIEQLAKLPVTLTLTTNGILADEYLDTLKKCGITSINVSIDSFQREKLKTINRRDYFDKIMSNIHLLIRENFHLKLNAVIMRGVNNDEIIDFIEFTKENKVHFRFIEFMPFDGNKWDWSKGVSYKEIIEIASANYGNNYSRLSDRKNDTSKNFSVNGYAGTFAIISSVTNPFCDTCNRLRLTADGKIKNCLFSNSETDLLSELRKGKDITPLILESVLNKKAVRAGMESFEEFSNPELNSKNRSMILIGG